MKVEIIIELKDENGCVVDIDFGFGFKAEGYSYVDNVIKFYGVNREIIEKMYKECSMYDFPNTVSNDKNFLMINCESAKCKGDYSSRVKRVYVDERELFY